MKRLKIVKFEGALTRKVFKHGACFFSELSEEELQEAVEEIVFQFGYDGFDDWTFEDVVKELYKRKLIEKPDFEIDWYNIWV